VYELNRKKSQREEISIENKLPISKKPQRGEILFMICRSAGAFGTVRIMNLYIFHSSGIFNDRFFNGLKSVATI